MLERISLMTKRRVDTYEECLKAFARSLKDEIKTNLKAWKQMDAKAAEARQAAFANVIFLLKEKAKESGVPLVDLGLVDYEVPKIEE